MGLDLDSDKRFFLREVRESLFSPESPSNVPDEELLAGLEVDEHILGRALGKGSTSVIFAAQGPGGGDLAVKVMPNPPNADPVSFALFEREVGIGRAIEHPSVLRTFKACLKGPARFVFMERVVGVTLRHFMSGTMERDVFLRLFRQIAEGLQAAHAQGIVHRDLKPENIMVDQSNRVKILDFGMARWRKSSNLTLTGQFKGTFKYCSPEQVQDSRTVDHACDQFAFGLMCFEALTGVFPFHIDKERPLLTLLTRVDEEPRLLRSAAPEYSAKTEAALSRMLRKEPRERYSSIDLAFATLAQSLR